MPNGTRPEIDGETFAKHSGLPLLRRLRNETDLDTLRRYIHHPDYVIRSAAAQTALRQKAVLVLEFLDAKDARVRRMSDAIDKFCPQLANSCKQITVTM